MRRAQGCSGDDSPGDPMPPGRAVLSLVALCALTGACGDGPVAPLPTRPIRVCSDAPFVAYQNEGGRWTHVVGDAGVF
jgi:hypothetical protein